MTPDQLNRGVALGERIRKIDKSLPLWRDMAQKRSQSKRGVQFQIEGFWNDYPNNTVSLDVSDEGWAQLRLAEITRLEEERALLVKELEAL